MTEPTFFKRTVDMPEGWSHFIVYHKKADGELDCVIHQARPSGRDYWSIERHLEGFTVFNPEIDVEILPAEFKKVTIAAMAAMASDPVLHPEGREDPSEYA